MNFIIYNKNTIFIIGLPKLNIMDNAIHMACRAQYNDQRRSRSIFNLVLGLRCGVLIIISIIITLARISTNTTIFAHSIRAPTIQ